MRLMRNKISQRVLVGAACWLEEGVEGAVLVFEFKTLA
jgi:hypothetical protein